MALCASADCTNGRAAVGQMWQTFNHLQATSPGFNSAKFAATVDSIQAALNAADPTGYAYLIPFNPTCCTVANIGRQADAVTNQMLASVGAPGVPSPPPPTDWTELALLGGGLLLLLVYSPQIKGVFKK